VNINFLKFLWCYVWLEEGIEPRSCGCWADTLALTTSPTRAGHW